MDLIYLKVKSSPDAKRLYDDLLSTYNRIIRPVLNHSDAIVVKLRLRLSQLIELNLRDQILSTNVWLEHLWYDKKLTWDPEEYGGVTQLYVPSEHIWLPDIVLYNNADGDYIITTMTKALITNDGMVVWNPPAILKTYCPIDVTFFPFDTQTCFMKFGCWSHDSQQIDLYHLDDVYGTDFVEVGIDLKEYYPSVEWDILSIPAKRSIRSYECCEDKYPDIFFNMTLRRKTLFYVVNLIVPCVGISALSVLVFYLPADCGEKVALSISILLSQTMFFLLISEIIPSTSLAVPLLGKYLLFTMFLVGLSVVVTIIILNVHYRKPSTHKMSPWVRRLFIKELPKLLLMRVPRKVYQEVQQRLQLIKKRRFRGYRNSHRWNRRLMYGSQLLLEVMHLNTLPPPPSPPPPPPPPPPFAAIDSAANLLPVVRKYPYVLEKAIKNVSFIQNHLKRLDEFNAEDQDWAFVAMVLDRLFLWIFTATSLVGTVAILMDAPALYDDSLPIDKNYSRIAKRMYRLID
ncbi:acetylcholine receptor subunit alpha-L1-like isoform X2 [Artemia franciscana]|uniref:acetylcholine receptor subunit alpha-L1-like isoform X2 n=1 Tax=Artemia franciscana TaxID=6661 RepID=UPI0032DACF44